MESLPLLMCELSSETSSQEAPNGVITKSAFAQLFSCFVFLFLFFSTFFWNLFLCAVLVTHVSKYSAESGDGCYDIRFL